jgi:hypothetical protein
MHDKTRPAARDRYPGYDVLTKRDGPSWNEKTREAIGKRLAVRSEPAFFSPEEFEAVVALADCLVPQTASTGNIPVAALIDRKLLLGAMDGYRTPDMPRDPDAWRLGLRALDAEAERVHRRRFVDLDQAQQRALLRQAEAGELTASAWEGMRSDAFFKRRLLRDVVLAYYAHPATWSEIGWGGPASPRGYVRLDFNERDPWEAAEARPGREAEIAEINRRVR